MKKIELWNVHIICEIDFVWNWVYSTCAIRQESKNKFSLREVDWADPRTSLGLIFWNVIFERIKIEKSIGKWDIKIIETCESALNKRWRVDNFNNYYELEKKYDFHSWDINFIKWSASLK